MSTNVMGKQRVDKRPKTMSPLSTSFNITPSTATGGRSLGSLGMLPIGVYKGAPAFWDLDKAVNQPGVWPEQLHILGVLDGREEDYDLQTVPFIAAEAVGTIHSATFTVPAGNTWFVNAIEIVLPASGGANIITGNWRNSLWTDRAATPSSAGQAFHNADLDFGVGGGTQWDEFSWPGAIWAPTNKQSLLRLPAATVITVSFTNTIAVVAGNVNAIARLYGFIGKSLVS